MRITLSSGMMRRVLLILSVITLLCAPQAFAQKKSGKAQQKQTAVKEAPRKSKAGGNTKKSSQAKGAVKKTASEVSSSELKKRQQSTQQEIKETRAKIATNEKSVSQGLADLSRIDADIKVTQKQIKDLATEVSGLDSRISSLTAQIAANEKELKNLREKYLVAVKKMRLSKGKNSTLSFIFSSRSFSEALRRVRYLREFNNWRDRQTKKIQSKNRELTAQNQQLSAAKKNKNMALSKEKQAGETLKNQFAKQDALVAQLKRQGNELKAHLAKKQAEANDLKNSISAAIAAEQKREAERRRAEEERLAEQKRKQEEKRLAEQRAAEQRAAEQRRIEAERAESAKKKQQSGDKQGNKTLAQQTPSKNNDKTTKAKERQKPLEKTPQQKPAEKKKDSNRSYADARKRVPRNTKIEGAVNSRGSDDVKSVSPAKPVQGGNFESMRGSLPRPVNGAFRVTSPFGRHSLPDLPGVTYDNPGIDAEVSAGASAQAVFEGKVTGIYRLPGYNTVVIVSHGNYYTVYGNLATTAVKNGDSVRQGQTIGKVANSDEGGRPSIHFEVWRNRDKLNPSEWIR